jgi:hypothetical protein
MDSSDSSGHLSLSPVRISGPGPTIKTVPQVTTDLFNQDLDRVYSWRLTEMVVLTQFAGLGLILGGLAILANLPRFQMRLAYWLFGVGLLALAVWVIYCWSDKALEALANLVASGEEPKPVPEAKRKTRVLRATLLIILLDALLLAILIPVTGGPGKSVLDPLVPIIPIIAIILKQPKRTVFAALGSGLVLVFGAMLHWAYHLLGFTDPALAAWTNYTHRDPRHALAYSVVTGGAIFLSVIELARYNRPEIGRGIRAAIENLLEGTPLQGVSWSIKRGTRTWIAWLDHRDLPLVDLSLVHSADEIVKQALVLCAPYWISGDGWRFRFFGRKRTARHVTFLTFAAHWIDDHFDAIGVYCHNEDLRTTILASSPHDVLKKHYPRLDELLKRMKGIVNKKHEKQVEHAVKRIIYGGLIQNARTKERKDELVKEYGRFVCHDKSKSIRAVYDDLLNSEHPLTMWVTAKVVMELLDSCTTQFSVDEAEFFNLLYGPLLYYHNWNKEVSQESFGKAFGDTSKIVQTNLPDSADMISLIERCSNLTTEIFGKDELPPGRQLQLRLLLRLYGDRLPTEVRDAYKKFLPA